MSKRTTNNILKNLYSYEDIPLKLFFEIAAGGDLKLLVKKGKVVKEQCDGVWEEIVKRNNKEAGNNNYNNYKDALEDYHRYLKSYHQIKACILKLMIRVDFKIVEKMAEMGYVISTSSWEEYEESLQAASRKSNNLWTKIASKQKEIEEYGGSENQNKEPFGFEQALAHISYEMKFNVDNDITLARYNEFRKLIKKNHQHGRRNNRQAGLNH